MNVLFLGDSITQGIPGVPYIPMIEKSFSKCSLINRGIGGDTVSSLLTRVKKMNDLSSFDAIVLFIGVNDVFGRMTTSYKILKTLKRQRWAKDITVFKDQYNRLISHISSHNKNIIIISPLIIGEDINNKWNLELIKYIDTVKDIAIKNNIEYMDLYIKFKEILEGKVISNYLPISVLEIYKDVKGLNSSSLVDKKSSDRGLHLTLDGVHLNSEGARLIGKEVINILAVYKE